MPRQTFQIRITGPERPEEVPLGYLGSLLGQLERALLSFARAEGAALPEDTPAISLVAVEKGSERLVLSTAEAVVPALAGLSWTIHDDAYEQLPREVHAELFALSEQVRARNWGLAFEPHKTRIGDQAFEIAPAAVTPERGVPPPPVAPTLQGNTTLLARCLRVGGATRPKAELRLSQNGQLLNVDVTEAIAKSLGRNLYEEVVVEGQATWNLESWRIVDFKVTGLGGFTRTPPHQAIRELATAARGRWEGVDALDYVRQLRGEGES